MLAINRKYRGEPCVVPCMIALQPTRQIDYIVGLIRRAKETPLDELPEFKRALNVARLPRPLRRLVLWFVFNTGRYRARYFGTFVVSTVSAFGGDLIHPLPVTSCFLTYGIIGGDARCPVRFIVDHRVLDGVEAARALVRLEAILNTVIVEELRAAAPAAAIRRAAAPESAVAAK